MRVVFGILVLGSALALSGCTGSTSAPPEGTALQQDVGDIVIPWGIRDCEVIVALVPVPAENVQPHVPDGFALATPSEAGLPAAGDVMGDALFAAEVFSCAEVSVDNTTEADVPYGSIFTVVHPPPGLEDADVDFLYLYKWDTLVVDPVARQTLQDLGIPAVDGAGSVTPAPASGQGPASASLTLGPHTYVLDATAATPPGHFGGTFIDFGPGPDGTIAAWKATGITESISQGRVSVSFPGGSLGAEIAGASQAPGFAAVGTVPDFRDGTLRFVPFGA